MKKSYFGLWIASILVFATLTFSVITGARRELTKQHDLLNQQYEQLQKWQTTAQDLLTSRGVKIDSKHIVSAADLLDLKPRTLTNYRATFIYQDYRLLIHLDRRLNNGHMFYGDMKLCEEMEKHFGKTTPMLVKSLLNVEGITSVAIDQYTVDITKAEAFRWDSMVDEITKILDNDYRDNSKG